MKFSLAFLAGVIATLISPRVLEPWLLALIGVGMCFALVWLIAMNGSRGARGGQASELALEEPRKCESARTTTGASGTTRTSHTHCGATPVYRTHGFIIVCGIAVGFLHAALQAHLYLSDRWPSLLTDERVIANVIIDTIPAPRGDSRTFDAIVTIESPTRLISGKPIRARLISRTSQLKPNVGDRWRLLLTIRPPRARVNPGTVDLERTFFRDRIHALGTVIDSTINRRIETGHRPLDALRERIAARIDAHVIDRDAAALITALAVGVTGAMSREQWRIFNATGTTHLVAISGLHVTLFAVIAFAGARRLWSVFFHRIVPWTRENFAALVGFIAATAYAVLTGLSVPTQRTLIMLGVWLFTRSIARTTSPFHSFALALIAVLLFDPFAPLAPGFWLSFGAMAAIILVTSTRFANRPMLREALAVQASVTVALVPLTLASFGSVSLIGPLVNILAIPAMSWLFVPVILFATVLAPVTEGASNAMLSLAEWMHDAGWPWLAAAADVPWALVHASPPLWWYAFAAIGVGISLMPLPRAVRLAALIWILPLAAVVDMRPAEGAADVTILDAGEGTAIVVQTSNHTVVFGTGDVYGSEGRTAESVLIPFLRSRGVHRIDTLVLDAVTAATAAGLTALLAELPIGETLVGGRELPDLAGARDCQSAGSWTSDGVRFRLIRATTPESGTCGLAIEIGETRVLIPGDIDASVERTLSSEQDLPAQVVIVPRHGSDSASSPAFTRAVGARWAVVPGRRDRNGHEKAALGRWREAGATVLTTADLGAIRFRIDARAGLAAPRGAREAERTLWRSSP